MAGIATASALLAAMSCGARSSLPAPERQGGGGAGGGPPDCVVFNSSAALAPLDLFVMLDASGSMQDVTTGGLQKWDAVSIAFDAFVHDSESNGIGMALSFFPIIDVSVPELCFDSDLCGVPDSCQLMNACPNAGTLCSTDEDCDAAGFPDDPCVPLGLCLNAATEVYCMQGQECAPGTGPCQQVGFCENRFTCESAPYGPPAFGVKMLPAAADEFVAVVDAKNPDGGTPTLPALEGVIDHAVDWSEANPTHNVIVVLATDGFPSVCDPDLDDNPPQAILNIANAAAVGAAAGISTWVIGVFSQAAASEAQANLDSIADAGGTGEAFVITTSGMVTNEFLAALNEVRLTAKSCEFELTKPDEPIDYTEVWVKITPKMGDPVWVSYVSSAAVCGDQGGFYYDEPLGAGVLPTKLILCPQTCAVLGASPNRTVEIFTTCPNPQEDG